jgi:hypothetical protein
MKLYVVVEEDTVGARVEYVASTKELAETFVSENYAKELRWLMDGVYRCGSSIISIQESNLDAKPV